MDFHSADAAGGGTESQLTASIQTYARQSGALFKELTTSPLMPPTSGVGEGGMNGCGGLTGVATTITLGNLAESVQKLTQRVGRLEALVSALDTTRRSQEGMYQAASRVDNQLVQEASLQPIKQSIAYHERILMEVAVSIDELHRNHKKQLESQADFTEKFLHNQQQQNHHRGLRNMQQQQPSTVNIQKSMERMSALASNLQKQRRDLTVRLDSANTGGDIGAGTTPGQSHNNRANNNSHQAAAPSQMLQDDRPPLTAAGAIIEGATTDTTTNTDMGATTVAMDNLSNVEGMMGGDSPMNRHHITATTVAPLDLSRTYQADVSGLSIGSVSNTHQQQQQYMTQGANINHNGPRGGSWKPRQQGTGNTKQQAGGGGALVDEVRGVIHPGSQPLQHHRAGGGSEETPDSEVSPYGTATTVLTTESPGTAEEDSETPYQVLQQRLRAAH